MSDFDVIIAGGGPGGLSAAQAAAERGARVLVLEQGEEIGSPTRTTGGSFVKDLQLLGIPTHLYHPIHQCRFVSPNNEVVFRYKNPVTCVTDVRGLFQFLAVRAIEVGASIRLGTTAVEPITDGDVVKGVRTKSTIYGDEVLTSSVLVDATGYRASLLRKAGVSPGFKRFGVGSEFDLYAPDFDQSEAVLIVGTQIAPAGYAWAFPWGNGRVRLGVGIIHADSDEHPDRYLKKLLGDASRFGMKLSKAQPLEYHYGLIPSDGLLEPLVGNGVLGVGDAAGQASALVGEGIRWAIKAGQMAGQIASEAVAAGDCSAKFLQRYQRQWKSTYGSNLHIAHEINKKMSQWDDAKWDAKTELLKHLSAEQFGEALQANFLAAWPFRLLLSHQLRRATRPAP